MGRHNSGMYYLKAAEKNGLKVKNGKGDHFKVYAPSGEMMVVPLHDELKKRDRMHDQEVLPQAGHPA